MCASYVCSYALPVTVRPLDCVQELAIEKKHSDQGDPQAPVSCTQVLSRVLGSCSIDFADMGSILNSISAIRFAQCCFPIICNSVLCSKPGARSCGERRSRSLID